MQGETPAVRAVHGRAPGERRRAPARPALTLHILFPSASPRPPPSSPPLQPARLVLHHLPSPNPSSLACPICQPARPFSSHPRPLPQTSSFRSSRLCPLLFPQSRLPLPHPPFSAAPSERSWSWSSASLSLLLLKAHLAFPSRSLAPSSHPFCSQSLHLSPWAPSLHLALLPRTLAFSSCTSSSGYLHTPPHPGPYTPAPSPASLRSPPPLPAAAPAGRRTQRPSCCTASCCSSSPVPAHLPTLPPYPGSAPPGICLGAPLGSTLCLERPGGLQVRSPLAPFPAFLPSHRLPSHPTPTFLPSLLCDSAFLGLVTFFASWHDRDLVVGPKAGGS